MPKKHKVLFDRAEFKDETQEAAYLQSIQSPQLTPELAPWIRPHGEAQTPWQDRPLGFSIPLFTPNVPTVTSNQSDINDFLEGLQRRYPKSTGALVITREVSAKSSTHQKNTFYCHKEGTQLLYGQSGNPDNDPQNGIPLKDYGTYVSEVARRMDMSKGTLMAIASRGVSEGLQTFQIKRQLVKSTGNQDVTSEDIFAARDPTQANPDDWHNVGLLAININKHGMTLCGVYIYDPSFPHTRDEKLYNDLVQGGADAGHWRQHLFMTNAYTMSDKIRNSYMSRRISGGGNIEGVNECRRMTYNWLQQVAWLISEVFSTNTTQAMRELVAFFEDYRKLRD